jgi:putative hydrolase of the HAD superfamily
VTHDSLTGAYSAIVFDCADTLLRMDPPRAEIFRDAVAIAGLTIPLMDVERAYEIVDFAIRMKSSSLKSRSAKADFYYSINAALCNVLGVQRSLPLVHPLLMAEFRRRRQWLPFPEAGEALRKLAARVPLYVLANWDLDLAAVLRRVGLGGFFREALSSEMLGHEKPERACFEAFLARTSLDPAVTVYVGNEYVADVVGSRSAGFTPVLVDRDGKMPSADCVRISSLAEVASALNGHLPDGNPGLPASTIANS